MLVLKRKDGQWVEVIHRSGDVLRFRVYGITGTYPPRTNIAFDDAPRHFEIRRPERKLYNEAPEPVVEAEIEVTPVASEAVEESVSSM